MAVATRSAIQKEIFSPLEERLVAIVNVTKPGRKKKSSFLCLSGKIMCCRYQFCRFFSFTAVNRQDKQAYVSRVKPVERKGGGGVSSVIPVDGASYRKTKTWGLGEIRVIDGHSTATEVTEFDLHIDKTVYKWVASNVTEKKSFISCIFKVRVWSLILRQRDTVGMFVCHLASVQVTGT